MYKHDSETKLPQKENNKQTTKTKFDTKHHMLDLLNNKTNKQTNYINVTFHSNCNINYKNYLIFAIKILNDSYTINKQTKKHNGKTS